MNNDCLIQVRNLSLNLETTDVFGKGQANIEKTFLKYQNIFTYEIQRKLDKGKKYIWNQIRHVTFALSYIQKIRSELSL